MDWTIIISSFASVITIIGTLGGMMFYFISKIDADIKAINARADVQNARIDQLYQMFVDLLKERKGKN